MNAMMRSKHVALIFTLTLCAPCLLSTTKSMKSAASTQQTKKSFQTLNGVAMNLQAMVAPTQA